MANPAASTEQLCLQRSMTEGHFNIHGSTFGNGEIAALTTRCPTHDDQCWALRCWVVSPSVRKLRAEPGPLQGFEV
jgi:hypothetical protein